MARIQGQSKQRTGGARRGRRGGQGNNRYKPGRNRDKRDSTHGGKRRRKGGPPKVNLRKRFQHQWRGSGLYECPHCQAVCHGKESFARHLDFHSHDGPRCPVLKRQWLQLSPDKRLEHPQYRLPRPKKKKAA